MLYHKAMYTPWLHMNTLYLTYIFRKLTSSFVFPLQPIAVNHLRPSKCDSLQRRTPCQAEPPSWSASPTESKSSTLHLVLLRLTLIHLHHKMVTYILWDPSMLNVKVHPPSTSSSLVPSPPCLPPLCPPAPRLSYAGGRWTVCFQPRRGRLLRAPPSHCPTCPSTTRDCTNARRTTRREAKPTRDGSTCKVD